MYLSIKYKYIILYSLLTILPIIMIDIWVYNIWTTKFYEQIVESDAKVFHQLNHSIGLLESLNESNHEDAAETLTFQIDYLVKTSDLDQDYGIQIIDNVGRMIYNNHKALGEINEHQFVQLASKTNGYIETTVSSQKIVVHYQYHDSSGWYLIGSIPKEAIDNKISNKGMMFTIIIVSFILSASSIVLISVHLTSPIRRLIDRLESGKLDTLESQDVIVMDEIYRLEFNFNKIISKLRQHMDLEYHLRMKSNEARFLALQSQINPHFLHNTLETINSIALIEKVPVIASLSRSLSKMFRYNTVEGNHFVTIKDELDHIEQYLNVQLIRFRGVLSKQINVEADVLNYKTIKFILQPLVENCFVHGFKDIEDHGLVKITGYKTNEAIILSIEDNGVGMRPEQIIEMNSKLRSVESFNEEVETVRSTGGVGVVNVHHRIKIHFGDPYGLTFKSLMPQGLAVEVRLPLLKE